MGENARYVRSYMNILYIFDDNYADISGVSIYSLFDNNKDIDVIELYIVDGGISENNKKKLENVAHRFKRSIKFIPFSDPDEKFGIKLDVANWCKTNYIRLYLEEILPESVEKVLYIDSDTLILGGLKELYNIDMGNKPIAAAYDCYPLPKYQLGFSHEDEYYSDGILLLDLKRLREMDTFHKYKLFLKRQGGRVAYLEQGTINYVMKGDIKLIPSRYNLMTLSLVIRKCPTIYFEKDEPYYNESEMFEAIKKPIIVHLTGHGLYTRPWQKKTNHPYAKEWIETLNRTPWCENFNYRKNNKSLYTLYIVICGIINKIMSNRKFAICFSNHSKRMKKINKYR